MGFAQDWGYVCVEVVNLFALISTNPLALKSHFDPIGPENNSYILNNAYQADRVILAWGAYGGFMNRGQHVVDMLNKRKIDSWVLGYTNDGHPKHPLYISKTQILQKSII